MPVEIRRRAHAAARFRCSPSSVFRRRYSVRPTIEPRLEPFDGGALAPAAVRELPSLAPLPHPGSAEWAQAAYASYPAIITRVQAAKLLGLTPKTLANTGLKAEPVGARGSGQRQHVRYRLADVIAYRLGRGA